MDVRIFQMVGKVMLGGYYAVLGGCQGVAMLFLGCCELLPGCICSW